MRWHGETHDEVALTGVMRSVTIAASARPLTRARRPPSPDRVIFARGEPITKLKTHDEAGARICLASVESSGLTRPTWAQAHAIDARAPNA